MARPRPISRPPAATPGADPVTAYAQSVVAGAQLAGRLVHLACERHLRDLEDGHLRGLIFDRAAALRAVRLFGFISLPDRDAPFTLTAFQQFIVGALAGWKWVATGLRRFLTAYVEMGRGNGKSPLAAGIGLGELVTSQESIHIYSAATTRDQAKILWGDADQIVTRTPALRKRIVRTMNNLAIPQTASLFRPLSADASKMDGLRVHMALVDEVHEHPSSGVIDKLNTGTKGAKQPLIFEITTAGYNKHSICYRHHEYSIKILERVFDNDAWFAYIATIDEGDAWDDPAVWIKANPNLGVTIQPDYLRRMVTEAQEMPGQQNVVRRLNLNQWVEQSTRWLDMHVWDAGADPIDPDSLRGRTCYAALDLARVMDLSALALLFPPVAALEKWKLLMAFWCPEENIETRARRDRVPYPQWRDQGLLTVTPGNTTDFRFIEADILKLARLYDIRELAYDRTFAGELVQSLQDQGMKMIEFGQGFLSMGSPTAEFQRLVVSRTLQHGGHPILRWNASNVAVRQDPAGSLKPDKEKSGERIDGIVAAIMALGRAVLHNTGDKWYTKGALLN